MKFFVLFFLGFIPVFAQQQFRASDFGYSNDVTKVEESLYKFNADEKQFVLENQYTTEMENGYFQKQVLVSTFGDKKVVGQYDYKYNSDFSLKEIAYQPVEGQFGYPMKILFNYQKGKLIKMIVAGVSTTFYSYDLEGNLSQEIQKDLYDDVVKTISYQNYTNKNTFQKIIKNGDATDATTTKEFYENGVLKRKEFVSDIFKSEINYTYDAYNNVLSQVYDDGSKIDFGYELDAKKNRNKIAKLSEAMPDDNSFTFVKITYNNGTTSGSTELDLDFVKKYDVAFRTKDSLLATFKDIKYSKNKYLNVLKGEEETLEVLDEFENNYEKVTSVLETTDKKSLIIYNEIDGTTHFLKDFYTENFPRHIWHETRQINSETNVFWIKNDKFQITFYQAGKYLESSNFSIHDDENPNHLLVKTTTGNTFQIRNTNSSEVGILYPLFKK